mmetsp:Transcript_20355/g.49978  ORF Transcript_20355/g.49978 Transcript_20355/m.49978 type:complete len:220 (+) Transcript_20355:92-751(+)
MARREAREGPRCHTPRRGRSLWAATVGRITILSTLLCVARMASSDPWSPGLQKWSRSRMVCYDFLNNKCRRGDSCKFAHKSEWKPKVLCRELRIKGNCTRGENCIFSHDLNSHREKRRKDKSRQSALIEKRNSQMRNKTARVKSLMEEAKSIIAKDKRKDRPNEKPAQKIFEMESEEVSCEDADVSNRFLEALEEEIQKDKRQRTGSVLAPFQKTSRTL